MCTLSATQVLASVMNKLGASKIISISQLIRYNELLLERLSDYHSTIDINDLSFEVASVACEFEIDINEDYEKIVRLNRHINFDYALYKSTMPEEVAKEIDEIDFPPLALCK